MKNAVIGTVSKAYGADTLTTTYKVEKALAETKAHLPAGVNMQTQVFRQANFIEAAIHNLNVSLLQGALIVIAVLFLFLANWRASLARPTCSRAARPRLLKWTACARRSASARAPWRSSPPQ